jgi:hypothetical protein
LQSNAVVRARRLDGGSGAFLDAAPIVVAFGSGGTDVVGLTDRWLVAWGSITAAFVAANGTPSTPFYAADTASSGTRFRLATNAQRDEATIVYQYGSLAYLTDVRMRRITITGVGVDPLLGPLVIAANQAQLRPTIAALDGEYIAAWADHRDVLDYEPGLGDVFAGRVNSSGMALDPSGIAVLDTPVAEGGAYLERTGRGTALLVASAMQSGAFGGHRLTIASYTNASAAPWTAVGNGLAGTFGQPTLEGYGPLSPSSAFDLTIRGALPNGIGLFAMGLAPANLPLFGGLLVPTVDILLVAPIDAAGNWMFAGSWPAGYASTSFWSQGWVLDAGGPQGFAATVGVRGTSP